MTTPAQSSAPKRNRQDAPLSIMTMQEELLELEAAMQQHLGGKGEEGRSGLYSVEYMLLTYDFWSSFSQSLESTQRHNHQQARLAILDYFDSTLEMFLL